MAKKRLKCWKKTGKDYWEKGKKYVAIQKVPYVEGYLVETNLKNKEDRFGNKSRALNYAKSIMMKNDKCKI